MLKPPRYRPRGFYVNLAVVSIIGVGITYYMWMPAISKAHQAKRQALEKAANPTQNQ